MSKEQKKEEPKDAKAEEKKEGVKEGEAPVEAVKEEPKIILMKKGDYSVHVLIEEIKNCVAIKEDQLPCPVVKVSCLGTSKRTEKIKLGCLEYVFDEHFFFDKTGLTVEMLDSEKIIIESYDNGHTKREDYFGVYEFDFQYIYNKDNHALRNFWIALANPEAKDITQVRGYLKLSISVLHDKDPRVDLTMSDSPGTDFIIPAQIKVKYQQISIHIFKGEELPDMDSLFFDKKVNRECDGFIEVKYLGVTRKTTVVPMKNELIEWNQIIDIPVSIPAVSQKIVLTIKDKDKLGDDLVGSIEINVSDILDNKLYDDFKFLHIYGSPLNKKGKIYDTMNFNSEVGSKWKGRVLMLITHNEVDTPFSRVRPITDNELIQKANKMGRPNLWIFHYRVISGHYLPTASDKYGFRLTIGEKTTLPNVKKAENKCINWNVKDTIQCYSLTADKDEIPDLFIYLTNEKDENICFQRIKAADVYLNKDILVIKLIPDPCFSKVENMMLSGIIKLKLCLIHRDLDKDFDLSFLNANLPVQPQPEQGSGPIAPQPQEDDDEDLEELVKKPEPVKVNIPVKEVETYTVVAVVYMSKYLIAGNSDGTSDPYVVLSLDKGEQKTSIKTNTVNGIWNEKLTFENIPFEFKDKSTWPIFLLNVLDYNTIGFNTPLGYNYLWLSSSAYSVNETAQIRPRWHKLFLPKSNKSQGMILMSFFIFDKAHKDQARHISYIPETVFYTCEINILGLRQLKPLSLLPVKKPFIKFDMNSLNVTGKEEDSLQPIQTIPSDCGENPTINSVIKFDAKLPRDEIFIPDLQCEVYDHLLNGLMKSLLGIFVLKTKHIIAATHTQIEDDMKKTQKKFGLMLNEGMMRKQFLSIGGVNSKTISIKNISDLNSSQRTKTMGSQLPIPLEAPLIIPSNDKTMIKQIEELKEPLVNSDEEIPLRPKQPIEQPESSIALPIRQIEGVEINADVIKDNKDNSKFYVITPAFKTYKIPGHGKAKKKPEEEGEPKQEQVPVNPPQPNEANKDAKVDVVPEQNQFDIADSIQKEFVIEDEEKAPDSSLYFKVGYLLKAQEYVNPEECTKHYRRIYRSPLESVPELNITSPFLRSKLRRGKYEDKATETGLFDALAEKKGKIIKRYLSQDGEIIDEKMSSVGSEASSVSREGFVKSKEKQFGKFKGLIRICEKRKMEEYQKCIDSCKGDELFMKNFKNLNDYENLRKKILAKKSVVIRVYILELNNLAKKDAFSESDPYIKLIVGNKVINEAKNHQDDQKNCKWYKHYDIPGEIPGSSTLTIEAWDWDPLLSDDLIGSTVIDLEDRFFCSHWQDMVHKPIEVRSLFHPDMNESQGQVVMWLEIMDTSDRNEVPPWSITPEPETSIEVRFIVWETEDMEMMDVEGTSDIYVIGYIDQENRESTDVHYRCQTGAGSFNWRMRIPCSLPKSPQVLTLQVYDNDLFSADDYICGTTINLKQLMTVPKLIDLPIKFTRDYYNSLSQAEKSAFGAIQFESASDDKEGIKFWVQCYKNGKMGGRVLCSLEILPQAAAELKQVGRGRDEPNLDPYLPPPVGRFEWSLNPFKLLNQCVGPKFRRKIYCAICTALIMSFLSALIPYVVLYISSEVVNPFNWK